MALAVSMTTPPVLLVPPGRYGSSLHVWDWSSHRKLQTIELGQDGGIPLEVRFLHQPSAAQGYVGCALTGSVFRIYRSTVSMAGGGRRREAAAPDPCVCVCVCVRT